LVVAVYTSPCDPEQKKLFPLLSTLGATSLQTGGEQTLLSNLISFLSA
jgi:hypothetical protein